MNHRNPFYSRLLILFLILLTAIATVTSASGKPTHLPAAVHLTSEERAWLDAHPDKLTLFFNTEFPPIEFISGSGLFAGMGADIISRIEKQLGVVFIKTPSDDWNKHLAALKSGKCAIAPTIVRTDEREAYTFFTKPYAAVPVVIITTRAITEKMTLDDLAGRRVGVVSGYATETYLHGQSARNPFELVPVNNVPEGLQQTAFGRIDAFVENLAVAAWYIEREGIPTLRVAGTTDYTFDWSIGISREYPLLFSAVNKALESIPAGELITIRKKWIAMEVDFKMDPKVRRNLILAALFTLLLLAGLTGITIILKRRLRQKVAGLKESEAKFRLIFESFEDLYYETDINGIITLLSPSVFSLSGWQPEELIGRPVTMVCEDYAQESLMAVLAEKGAVKDYELTLKKRDGSEAIASLSGHMIYDPQGAPAGTAGLLRDITARKNAELQREAMLEAVRQSEEKYRVLFDNAVEGVFQTTPDGHFLSANPSLVRIMGFNSSGELFAHFNDIGNQHYLNPEDRYTFRRIIETEGVINAFETQLLKRDGTPVWASLKARTVRNDAGAIQYFEGFLEDITERKQAEAEQEKLQARLSQAQKMESIGTLAGGIAHDFNNMLTVILGYAQSGLNETDPSHSLHHKFQQILNAAGRSADITRQLLAFARKQTIDPKVLDLNLTLEGMLSILRRLIGEDIDLSWKPAEELWPVKIDPSQIDQILANLCINARDAIAGVGKLTIETGMTSIEPAYCDTHDGFMPGDFVLLAVSDTGCGMKKEIMDNLFEPFFTTKDVGKGTGLGLATVYGIVRQNNGFIHVYSEPGQGTTFRIYLPRYRDNDELPAVSPPEGHIPKGAETILLVEDEPMILEMTTEMLESLGYSVIAADRPGKAIRMAGGYAGKIHLLMTDVVLPEMNGRDLSGKLASLYPQLKCLFMSGYTANVIAHQGRLDEGVAFIQKPFSMTQLAGKIRWVLDQT